MKECCSSKLRSRLSPQSLLCTLFLACGSPSASAFPPAPYYTVYGDVRDQYGRLLAAEGCSVVLYQDSREIFRQALGVSAGPDANYRLRMLIDIFRSATSAYSSSAVKSGSGYALSVSVGNPSLDRQHGGSMGSRCGDRSLAAALR
jgi:hypothetical protein